MKLARILIPVALLMWLLAPGDAAAGFRCGVDLITEGDSKYESLAKCGEPDYIESWEEERVYRGHRYRGRSDIPGDGGPSPYLTKVTIRFERWTYNLGPHRLIHHLLFENDRLKKVTTDGYGF